MQPLKLVMRYTAKIRQTGPGQAPAGDRSGRAGFRNRPENLRSRSMRAPRTSVCRLGLIWSASLFALSAMAAGAPGADDVLPPDLPEAALSMDLSGAPAQAPGVASELRIDSPDLPAITVSVPPAAPAIEVAAPTLPDAPVTITAADLIRPALAAQLAKALEERTLRLPRKERESLAAYYQTSGY